MKMEINREHNLNHAYLTFPLHWGLHTIIAAPPFATTPTHTRAPSLWPASRSPSLPLALFFSLSTLSLCLPYVLPLTDKQLEIIGNYCPPGALFSHFCYARIYISILAIIDFVKRWRSRFHFFCFAIIILLNCCFLFPVWPYHTYPARSLYSKRCNFDDTK